MLKKGKAGRFATATVATSATDRVNSLSTVASVATVNVAVPGNPTANEPIKRATSATIRPPGLTPKLLAASLVLDAQIAASDQFRNCDKTCGADPDRYCWPHSTAMNTREIDLFAARLAKFTDMGVPHADAEALADKLVLRDREASASPANSSRPGSARVVGHVGPWPHL